MGCDTKQFDRMHSKSRDRMHSKSSSSQPRSAPRSPGKRNNRSLEKRESRAVAGERAERSTLTSVVLTVRKLSTSTEHTCSTAEYHGTLRR
eukprot:6196968-Pleurochrysis_carterae.AAC.4